MRYLSLFSGIEAASAAWHPMGWQCAAVSEIEPFPCAVLAHHYPTVPNLGDITKFKEWPDLGTVDLVVGGSPCQSFSVAGLRKGMDDPRGNLMLTYLAVINRVAPRWVVYENVPGLLSSNGGRDFGTLLGGLAELGYGFAYRVLDAQYIRVESHSRAVPQRRRRVFVVGHLGDWRRAAAVLFERESLLGHPAPSRETGQRIAATLTRGAESSGKGGYAGRRQEDDVNIVVAPTLSARTRGGGGLGTDFDCDGELVAHSLRGEGFGGGHLAVAFDLQQITSKTNRSRVGSDLPAPTMAKQSDMHVATDYAVRRLTPMECERLQGFPDLYTNIEFRGKRAADGNRYKALGNSMAVNVMRWLGDRIQLIDSIGTQREAA